MDLRLQPPRARQCPLCRGSLEGEGLELLATCAGCATSLHLDCLRELGGGHCPTAGCGRDLMAPRRRLPETAPPAPPPVRGRRRGRAPRPRPAEEAWQLWRQELALTGGVALAVCGLTLAVCLGYGLTAAAGAARILAALAGAPLAAVVASRPLAELGRLFGGLDAPVVYAGVLGLVAGVLGSGLLAPGETLLYAGLCLVSLVLPRRGGWRR